MPTDRLVLTILLIVVLAALSLAFFTRAERQMYLRSQTRRDVVRREKARVVRGSLAGGCACLGGAVGAIGSTSGSDGYVVAALVLAAVAVTLSLSALGGHDVAA